LKGSHVGEVYEWDINSTYIQSLYFENSQYESEKVVDIINARL